MFAPDHQIVDVENFITGMIDLAFLTLKQGERMVVGEVLTQTAMQEVADDIVRRFDIAAVRNTKAENIHVKLQRRLHVGAAQQNVA